MPISPARSAAFSILLRVEQEDAYASELLHSAQYARLSPADHGLTTELVMGVLRWRSLLDQQIAAQSSYGLKKLDPEILTALRLGFYQIGFLERVPTHAAVHESVELVKQARKRSAAGFVNAILRKAAQQQSKTKSPNNEPRMEPASTAQDLATSSAHPLWMLDRWVDIYGVEAVRKICAYDQRIPQTTIRLMNSDTEREIQNQGIDLAPGKLLTSARRVLAGDITRTDAFRSGRVTIQDEASQLVALLLGEGRNILDCCAAPGGKTRVLAEGNPDAIILAVELHPHRARLLRKLVSASNVEVLCADSTQLPLSAQFDHILVDAPCSGTGTLARNPEIKWQLKPDDLHDLSTRQLTILQSAMQHLSPGGRIVYSTCSLEPEENQEVVQSALALDSSFHLLDCRGELNRMSRENELALVNTDSLVSGPYLRTLPGIHPCDGFFAALLEK